MSQIFISYSRKDKKFAQDQLVRELESRNFECWIDVEDIPPTADWQREIDKNLEKSIAVVFVISPDSISSQACQAEIEYAINNGKRIIPIVWHEIASKDIPEKIEEIKKINWIFFRDGEDNFSISYDKLIEAIITDLDWVEFHTILLQKASEWESTKKSENKSKAKRKLLHGTDVWQVDKKLREIDVRLREAKYQPQHEFTFREAEITPLLREYAAESKKEARATLVKIFLSVASALFIIFILAKQTAIESEARAQAQLNELARQLVVQAQYIDRTSNSQKMIAVLLATESMKIFPSSEAAQILINNNIEAQLLTRMAHDDSVLSVAFSPDGKYVLSGSADGTARVWEVTTGKEITREFINNPGNLTVAFSPDGKDFVSTACGPRIWETLTGKEVSPGLQPADHCNIFFATFSPNGKYIVSNGCDMYSTTSIDCIQGTINVWELATGNIVAKMTYSSGGTVTAFSPDSRYLASGKCDKVDSDGNCLHAIAFVWEVATGTEVARMSHDSYVSSVAFSPDGKYVVSAGGTTARVWEAATGKEVARMTHNNFVNEVAFSPDGKHVVSGDNKYTALWDIATGREIARMTHDGAVLSVAFSPDGEYVASGSIDGAARVWEVATGIEVAHMTHDGPVRSIAFSPDSQYVVSGSDDKSVRVWKTFRRKNSTYDKYVSSVAFSPDGKYLVSGSYDKTVRISEVDTGREVARMTHDEAILSVAFSPDGKYVVSGSDDKTVRIWEAATGREIVRMTHDDFVREVAFSPDGKHVISGSGDRTARVWDATTGREIARMTHDYYVVAVAFSPDGKYVVSGSDDKTVRVWETTTGREIARITHSDIVNSVHWFNNIVTSVAFSPDGKYVVSGGADQIVHVWDATTGREIARTTHNNIVLSVAFSPNGKYVVSGSADKTARIWEVSTGKEIARMTHDGSIFMVAFSPDGKYVISGSDDRTARVWDATTGREIARTTHNDIVWSVAFSPNGKYVVSMSIDKTVRVWLWRPADLLANACEYLPRNLTHAEWKQYIGELLPYQAVCENLPLESESTFP